MTNYEENVNFFSFDKLIYKNALYGMNILLDIEDLNSISAICSYKLIFDGLMRIEQNR